MQMYLYSWVYYALHYFILFIEFGDENKKKQRGGGQNKKNGIIYTHLPFDSKFNSCSAHTTFNFAQKHSKNLNLFSFKGDQTP